MSEPITDPGFEFVARHWLAFIEAHPHRSGNDEAMMAALRRFLDVPPVTVETITLHVTRPADPELTCMGCKGGNCDGEMHMRLDGTTAAIGFHDRCKPRAVHPAPLPADVHAAAREAMRLAEMDGADPIAVLDAAMVAVRAVLARPASTVPTDASLPRVKASDMQRREEMMRAGVQHAVVDDNGKIMQIVGLGARRYLPEPDDVEGAASEGVPVEGVVQSFDRAFGVLVIKTFDNIDPLLVESLEPRVTVTPLPTTDPE